MAAQSRGDHFIELFTGRYLFSLAEVTSVARFRREAQRLLTAGGGSYQPPNEIVPRREPKT